MRWSGVTAQVSKSVRDLEERVQRETLGSFLGDDGLEFRDLQERRSSKRGGPNLWLAEIKGIGIEHKYFEG